MYFFFVVWISRQSHMRVDPTSRRGAGNRTHAVQKNADQLPRYHTAQYSSGDDLIVGALLNACARHSVAKE